MVECKSSFQLSIQSMHELGCEMCVCKKHSAITNMELHQLINSLGDHVFLISLCFFAGTEEAGKSMLIKQLKIIHGCRERDRDEFKVLVYRNVFTDIQNLTKAMETLHIPYENPANEVCMLSAPRLQ